MRSRCCVFKEDGDKGSLRLLRTRLKKSNGGWSHVSVACRIIIPWAVSDMERFGEGSRLKSICLAEFSMRCHHDLDNLDFVLGERRWVYQKAKEA